MLAKQSLEPLHIHYSTEPVLWSVQCYRAATHGVVRRMASSVPSRIISHVNAVQVGVCMVPVFSAPAALLRGDAIRVNARIFPSMAMKKANKGFHFISIIQRIPFSGSIHQDLRI
jgi:hypothetical protein